MRKINFYQESEEAEDYFSDIPERGSTLCRFMMNIRREEQYHTVCAASSIWENYEKNMMPYVRAHAERICCGTARRRKTVIIEEVATDGLSIMQGFVVRQQKTAGPHLADEKSRYKMLDGANVLLVANRYDEITAMTLQGTAQSEVKALQELLEHPKVYDPETVRALIRSINILPPGASVELSTGEKALVLNENEESVLRPTVVSFRDNSILDLSLPGNEDIQIVDVMKTMDNRYIFNK